MAEGKNRVMKLMPDGTYKEVEAEPEQPKTVKVKPQPKEEPEKPELTAAQRIMQAITETPKDRMSEMTYLTKQMAFFISLQIIQNPVFSVDAEDENGDIIDLLSLWEEAYYKLCRSVGGEWADMTSELARIQMAGVSDDGMGMGSEM